VTRAIKAAVAAGVDIARIETDKAGKIAIIAGGGTGEPGETQTDMATPAGFEPATFSLEGCCSIP
jgi:hypothetical protein